MGLDLVVHSVDILTHSVYYIRRQSIGKVKGKDHASQTLAATSTSGLILHDRPK